MKVLVTTRRQATRWFKKVVYDQARLNDFQRLNTVYDKQSQVHLNHLKVHLNEADYETHLGIITMMRERRIQPFSL